MRHKTVGYGLAAGSRGQTMAEYALILVTVAVIATALVQSAGTILTTLVTRWSCSFPRRRAAQAVASALAPSLW